LINFSGAFSVALASVGAMEGVWEGKGDSDVQSPRGDGEMNVLCAGIGQTSYGGARQFVLLDIMLWLSMGCFGDAARGECVEDRRWDASGSSL